MRYHYGRRELERMDKRFTFVYWAGVLGTAILIGGAVTGGVSVANSSANVADKAKQSQEDAQAKQLEAMKTVTPSVTSADEAATKNVEKQRRMRALSGGKTLLTNEGLGGSTAQGTAPKSLLGN